MAFIWPCFLDMAFIWPCFLDMAFIWPCFLDMALIWPCFLDMAFIWPCCEKTCLQGLQRGKAQPNLLSYRDYLASQNFA